MAMKMSMKIMMTIKISMTLTMTIYLRLGPPLRFSVHDIDVSVAKDVAVSVGGVTLKHRSVRLAQFLDDDHAL